MIAPVDYYDFLGSMRPRSLLLLSGSLLLILFFSGASIWEIVGGFLLGVGIHLYRRGSA